LQGVRRLFTARWVRLGASGLAVEPARNLPAVSELEQNGSPRSRPLPSLGSPGAVRRFV